MIDPHRLDSTKLDTLILDLNLTESSPKINEHLSRLCFPTDRWMSMFGAFVSPVFYFSRSENNSDEF